MTTSVQSTNPVVHTLDNIQNICDQDVIFLLGKTRAGKSTFINDTLGERVLDSTASMTSDTVAISYVQVSFDDNRLVNLVDTIGFGGSYLEHTRPDLAARYVSILHSSEKEATIKAFLYLIDITDAAGLDQENQKNLDFLAALVGEEVFSSVVFVTTKWGSPADEDTREVQEERHSQWERILLDSFPGSRLVRLDDQTSRRSAKKLEANPALAEAEKVRYRANTLNVIRLALERPATRPTQLEQEVNGPEGANMTIGDTSLGQVVKMQVQQQAASLAASGQADAANALLGYEADIARLRVDDLKLAEKAREAGARVLSLCPSLGAELGELFYRYGKVAMEVVSAVAPRARRAAIMETFNNGVERTVQMATHGAQQSGIVGGVLAAAAGAAATVLTSVKAASP
ncbi:p-loop containing nucleoside triphosphate hydrolase protein [Mycena sanguinolenta]|uniref:p-loop containing nucleoside triphosphate hydrolase protein n=1 Tax=Mycena sanguinolenta TaxID=230812 RepID=A0A8H7CVG0_9AGAR|nr:p-loop containing nucleoside triphosphate hydrolase protein [Mycena sanguinolenta]